MSDFPRSLIEFQRRFPGEAACAAYLEAARWPNGFVCPACDGVRGWALDTKAWTHECAQCGKQTSVTAGTVMHGSKLPLTAWFWAAYLMATHSNGISALQLQKQLGLGSYKSCITYTAGESRPLNLSINDSIIVKGLAGQVTGGWQTSFRKEQCVDNVRIPESEATVTLQTTVPGASWPHVQKLVLDLQAADLSIK
jgi:hypothetical protein